MRTRVAGFVVVAVLTGSSAAHAASGSLIDPKGDYPDIVKLAFGNARTKVTVTMTYAGGRAQNESFYLRWGSKGQSYQVFVSRSVGMKELRYYSSAKATGKRVACKGLVVRRPTALSTTAIIPRTCLAKAPDKLRFQGIATEGLSLSDETKLSPSIKRG